MKLGSQTGSLTNHILSRAVVGQPEPVVGMGATILAWTDRYAGTITNIIETRGGTVVTVTEDKAQRVDRNGYGGFQEYEYSRDHNGQHFNFRRNKNGAWEEVVRNLRTHRWNKLGGYGLRIGDRDEYRDPSF